MSELGRHIAIHLYENQAEIWSHIENFRGIPRPLNYKPAKKLSALANPFARKYRSAALTDEVGRLYNCLAFAMHQYGAVMNGHMTVAWELFGIRDHVKAAAALTEFNARTRKWLEVEGSGRRRKGTKSETWGPAERYYYAYVHEHASTHGFHTHQLFHVSDGKARAFAERAVKCLAQLTGVTNAPAEAVVITPNTVRDGFAPYLPRFKRNEEDRCWVWFRYLAKNLSPHEFKQVGGQCLLQREIFRIRPVFIAPAPVTCTNLFGCSENIAVGAQTKAGFVSKFELGDWKNLYSSSELEDFRQRRRAWEREQELASILGNLTI
ncbi:hypothetical protein ACQR09_31580 [Bradyrhizobium oligotrophicum]|uniref:hypothetical protein n=1 Tax=Bradyrhizobium oligotrophicum TaxID=44255 RepID=UPI003EBF7517